MPKLTTLTLETGISEGLKIQFINESVILYNLSTLTTSKTIEDDRINIKTSNHDMLKYIIDKIDKTQLSVSIVSEDDTVIVLSWVDNYFIFVVESYSVRHISFIKEWFTPINDFNNITFFKHIILWQLTQRWQACYNLSIEKVFEINKKRYLKSWFVSLKCSYTLLFQSGWNWTLPLFIIY